MPPTLTSFVLIGSSTERGTERSAASWKTPSTPATARAHGVRSRRSPSTSSTPSEAGEVLAPAGREVVEHAHAIAPPDERLGDVRADEAGAAGDEVELALQSRGGLYERPPRAASARKPGARLPAAQCRCTASVRRSWAVRRALVARRGHRRSRAPARAMGRGPARCRSASSSPPASPARRARDRPASRFPRGAVARRRVAVVVNDPAGRATRSQAARARALAGRHACAGCWSTSSPTSRPIARRSTRSARAATHRPAGAPRLRVARHDRRDPRSTRGALRADRARRAGPRSVDGSSSRGRRDRRHDSARRRRRPSRGAPARDAADVSKPKGPCAPRCSCAGAGPTASPTRRASPPSPGSRRVRLRYTLTHMRPADEHAAPPPRRLPCRDLDERRVRRRQRRDAPSHPRRAATRVRPAGRARQPASTATRTEATADGWVRARTARRRPSCSCRRCAGSSIRRTSCVSPDGLRVDLLAGGDDRSLGRGAAKTYELWIAFGPAAADAPPRAVASRLAHAARRARRSRRGSCAPAPSPAPSAPG